ncbi:MAG TPA: lysophospholipid acyltransferase family protein [Saprospiraceae bacterium]|nr:lysophospholipid acyltransferase family protein [Saprospiraceae bacterium]
MQGWFRALWRFFYFILSTIFHIAGFVIDIILGKPKKAARTNLKRKWLDQVPPGMGLEFSFEGNPDQGTCLFVSNHIGYLDPFAILMHVDANLVAKSEVSRWPLIGLAGYLAGTIFVNRDKKSSRSETAEAIRRALEDQTSILVFPEGTTSAGHVILPFRPRSFEAANLAGVPVQPIVITYDHPAVAFIDDHTFIPHFFRLFQIKEIKGHVVFGPLFIGANTCNEARHWMEQVQSFNAVKEV